MMCADAAGSCLQVLEEAISDATSLVVASRNTSLPVVHKQLAKLLPQVCQAAVCILHAHLQQAPSQGYWPLCWRPLACVMVCWLALADCQTLRATTAATSAPCLVSGRECLLASCRVPAGGTHCWSTSAQSVAALLKVPLVSRVYDGEQLQLPAWVQFVDPSFLARCVAHNKLLDPIDHPLQVGSACFPL